MRQQDYGGPKLDQLWVGSVVLLPTFFGVPAIVVAAAVAAGLVSDPAGWTQQELIERGVMSHMAGCLAVLLISMALGLRIQRAGASLLTPLKPYAFFFIGWMLFLTAYLWLVRAIGEPVPLQNSLEYVMAPRPAEPTWWVVVFAVVVIGPLAEEVIFRGFVQQLIKRYFDELSAIVLTGIVFGLIHGLPYALPLAIVGMFFGWLRERAGGLWSCSLAHMVHNGVILALALSFPDFMRSLYEGLS